jgi:hypothetical protein
MLRKMTKEEASYIAGFIDADGCIAIQRAKSYSGRFEFNFALRLIAVNSNLDVLNWIKETTGVGHIYLLSEERKHKSNWKAVHRYTASTKEAVGVLQQIVPYMKVKKERAELAIAFCLSKNGNYRDEESYNKQYSVFNIFKKLNKRGVDPL